MNNEKLIKLPKQVEELTTQIKQMKSGQLRKFSPLIGASPYITKATTLAQIDTLVDSYSDYGIECINIMLHDEFSNGSWSITETVEQVRRLIDRCKFRGIKVSCLKVHSKEANDTIETIDVNKWKTEHKENIRNMATIFKNDNIEYLTVLNESPAIYGNANFESYVNELLTLGKSLGYKVGVTVSDFDQLFNDVLESIKQNSDCFFTNLYPRISNKMEKSTVEDGINGWNYNKYNNYLDVIKQKYNKPLIISEAGVQDYWCALSLPYRYNWDSPIISNGEAPRIFYYGLLNVMNHEIIKEAWMFYDVNYPQVKDLITEYVKGE